ncbi:AtzG-like protein [Comamonas endophytica]|uniref:DUF4089 domain-containing protein n=1 Tax=Comamonas endophytica TaxID=2949090 RepID=A0ABY6GCL2_9BURK|nr:MULTISPECIES: DUF4089 domain-containing protein [unclassified Acidovorax]MCD2513006.1 DUF4089 domain-containing protein [Acidovorax sp. D4N7]UYG52653.1 DUF4089 domain-containing protein [Acidovorax sp. 5MLIR]
MSQPVPSAPAASAADIDAYVRAAMALQGYDATLIPPAQVAEQFARIAAMAAALRLQPLARQDEAAYVFRP